MVDGPSELEDLHKTEANKALVQAFLNAVLVGGETARIGEFVSKTSFAQHSPGIADGISGLKSFLDGVAGSEAVRYWKVHKLVGQGNFVAALCHAQKGDNHFCVFHVFRLKDEKIVEHWDVTEKILAPEEWKNQGKF